MNTIKIITVLMIAVALTACGYKLAGKADLDPVFDDTHVSYQGAGKAMADLVEAQLIVNKVNLVSAEYAESVITILYERQERDVLSVDEEGKVREYELILQVGVGVTDADGKRLIKNQDIRLSRDFLFEIDEVLGSEENVIYQEMREDAARLIIYRLQAISTEVPEEKESS